MSTRITVAALAALSVAQLAAAAWSIARYESTLASGALYRIRTVAMDPADAFRGRYVAVQPAIGLRKPIASETETLLQRIMAGETGYVVLTTGADGFAEARQLLMEPPPEGDYLKIVHVWQQWTPVTQPGQESTSAGYNLIFPFDRYYMNEAAAPEAETRVFAARRGQTSTDVWLSVRVKDGAGVIEGLFVGGVAIEELVRTVPKP
jgi:uncharacterized membrane-anchored protein